MNDFLLRLFRFVGHPKRLDCEDFVSLCVGRHLERDPDFSSAFLATVADQLDKDTASCIRGWLQRDSKERRIEVRAQVPAFSKDDDAPGRADLVVDLDSTPHVKLVFEAKVGGCAPSEDQLNRYRRAFPGSVVLCLVERRALGDCPPKTPKLSWDDVLCALPTSLGPDLLPGEREDLRKLMAQARVGDMRLTLSDETRSKARFALKRMENLHPKLADLIVEMGPNKTIRSDIEEHLKNNEAEPDNAWGTGFIANSPLKATGIQGITLGLDAGEHLDELVWKLEVYTSKTVRKALEKEDGWNAVRGEDGWFETEIFTSKGDRNLVKDDFARALSSARAVLRHIPGVKWITKGEGNPPYSPQNFNIPEINRGIREWEPVAEALNNTVRDVVSTLVMDEDAKIRWYSQGWRSGPLPGGRRIYAWSAPSLDALHLEIENAGYEACESMRAAAASWSDKTPGRKIEITEDPIGVILHLDDSQWRSPVVLTCLVDIVKAGLKEE